MKKEDLFEAMNDIDDSLLDENVTEIRHSPWVSVVMGAVACVAVSVGVIYALPKPRIDVQEITIMESMTETLPVSETVTEVRPLADVQQEEEPASDDCLYISVPGGYSVYDTYYLKDDENDWPIFAEIEIDETLGHISLITAYDSNSLPKVGNLVRTETGYECQINGIDFTLEYYESPVECLAEPLEKSEMPLMFHAENHPLDGTIFDNQIQPCQYFEEIQAEEIQNPVFWRIYDTGESGMKFDILEQYQADISERFVNLLRNTELLTPTLCHDVPESYVSFNLNGEEYQIAVTANYFIMNNRLYHATPETLKAWNLFCQELKDIQGTAFPEETTTPVISMESNVIMTTAVTESETVVTSTSHPLMVDVIHLPNMPASDMPEPVAIDDETETIFIDDETEPIQTETIFIDDETEPEQTVTSEIPTETVTTSAVIDEIPSEVLNALTEIDGVMYSIEDEPHIEIEPEQGIYQELYLNWAVKYYPDRNYAVQIHMHTGNDSTIEEKQQLLEDLGINTTGIFNYDRIQAVVSGQDLEMLGQNQEYGFLIDLLPSE